MLALGERNIQPIESYASLHQENVEEEATQNGFCFNGQSASPQCPSDLTTPSLDPTDITDNSSQVDSIDEMHLLHPMAEGLQTKVYEVCNDIVSKLKRGNENFIMGVSKFVSRYEKLIEGRTCSVIPRIASVRYTFASRQLNRFQTTTKKGLEKE